MEDSVQVRVLFFAKARELVERSEATLNLPSTQITRVETIRYLEVAFPILCQLKRGFIVALNEEYFEENEVKQFKSDDQLAVIPPISGG
jgi:molybdopterin converting factor subunit 1